MTPPGGEPAAPFFIVGCGRSGTTLLRTMLNRHSLLTIPLESLFLADYLRAARHRPLETIKRQISREVEVREWGLSPGSLDLSNATTIQQVVSRLHLAYARNRKPVWGQKTPRLVRYLELIRQDFPNARFIHIVRDPRAVAASLKRSPAHASTAYHGALRWQRDTRLALDFERRYPDQVLRLSYEALIADPGATLASVCDFLGVSAEPAAWEAQGEQVTEFSNRYYGEMHRNVHQGIRSDRTDAWRNELTPGELATVEEICGETMAGLGYAAEASASPLPRQYYRLARLAGLVRQLFHYLRHRPMYLVGTVARKLRLGLFWQDLRHLGGLNR